MSESKNSETPLWSRLRNLFGAETPSTNGAPPPEAKSGVTLDARSVDFFSADGSLNNDLLVHLRQHGQGHSEAERVSNATAYAAAAYAHVAIRYRMRKVAEPPLMVAQLGDDDTETWLPRHPMSQLLETPGPDYDMGELLQRTQAYVDITGACTWVKDLDAAGRVGRLVPFSGEEVRVEPANGRMRGLFHVEAMTGENTFTPEEVVYFHEINPRDWTRGTSLLDVSLGWLNLSQQARAAVQGILENALFPSVLVQTDPEWRPSRDSEEWLAFQDALRDHARNARRGEPLALTGGGSATVVTPTLKDMVPGDILNRVESVMSSVFGVPAVVLQYHVGIENSPWSQMAEARRMCYEDTIEPLWREREKALTRQLLLAPSRPGGAPVESNRRRVIRFDTSRVRALRQDRARLAQIAGAVSDFASINERRAIFGLDPTDDPAHDEVPRPSMALPAVPPADPVEAGRRRPVQHKRVTRADLQWKQFDALTRGLEPAWRWEMDRLLAEDREEAAALVQEHSLAGRAGPPERKAVPDTEALLAALDDSVKERWGPVLQRLVRTTGASAATQLAQDVGVSFDLLTPGVQRYTASEAAWLITQVTDTTKAGVRQALSVGVAEGEGIPGLARRIREADGIFGESRSTLIARTEVTRVVNGAQRGGMDAYAQETGATVLKSWLATRDDRTRDEHLDMDGVEVGVDALFDTDDLGPIQSPEAPNCRCTLTYRIEE